MDINFKNTVKILALPALLSSLLTLNGCVAAQNTAVPLKIKKLLIQDHECLKYATYAGSEKEYELIQVYNINAEENTVTIYQQRLSENADAPKYLTNFTEYKKVSLIDRSLLSYHMEISVKSLLGNKAGTSASDRKGKVTSDMQIDRKNETANYRETEWDGYKYRTRNSRIKIKAGYPVWDFGSLIYVGARFLDLKSSGIVYGIIPEIIKEPIPVSFKFLGNEVIETKAGRFNTAKFGFYAADIFLSKLMENYKDGYFWIDESENGRIIEIQIPGGNITLLEGISIWKD